MAQTEATRNRLDALGVVALAASSFAFTAGGYVINKHGARLDSKDSRITTLEIESARVSAHNDEHEIRAAHWIQQIIDLTRRTIESERKIVRLETYPIARADPFTGKDGDRLESMFLKLQKLVDALQVQQMEDKDQ